MARVAQAGHTDTNAAYNRTLTKHHAEVKLHVVPDPAKFELGNTPETEQRTELVMQTYVSTSIAAKCLASDCAMWRWASPGRGYCGLAGKP